MDELPEGASYAGNDPNGFVPEPLVFDEQAVHDMWVMQHLEELANDPQYQQPTDEYLEQFAAWNAGPEGQEFAALLADFTAEQQALAAAYAEADFLAQKAWDEAVALANAGYDLHNTF